MQNEFTPAYRENMVRCVFSFILASFIFRYYNHVMLYQMLQPVIYKTNADLAYWAYHISGVKQIIVQSRFGSLLFDCLLTGLCIACIIFPRQRFTLIVFSILYPCYFLSYNAYVTHHTGTMNGILLITFAFWAVKETNFRLLWNALRYYTLAIYCMAFFWKTIVGVSVFHASQAQAIVQPNLALYLFQNPATFTADCMRWCLQHPLVLYLGYCCCILAQATMAIGFFTKKYDRLLFILPICFHLSTYFFVDVCYFELLILNFTLVRVKTLQSIIASLQTKWPVFNQKILPG